MPGNPLYNVPGLGGYVAQVEANNADSDRNLARAMQFQTMQAHADAMDQERATRQALSESGGDPEKAVALALGKGNYAAASKLAPLAKLAQEERQRRETAQAVREINAPPTALQAPSAQIAPDIPTAEPQDAAFSVPTGAPAPQADPADQRQQRLARLQKLQAAYASNPAASTAIAKEMDRIEAQKPIFNNDFPVGNNMVQPHVSYDNGKTFTPVPGSKPIAKFASLADQGVAAVPQQLAGLSGDDYLSKLPKDQANLIRGIAEGRINPASLSTRGGHRERILQQVSQYDPTFDQTTYGTRAAIRKDFTSGPTAKNITAINTAIGHIGSMADLADAMQNGDARLVNAALNRLKTETGNPNVNNFEIARDAVANELMRVFRQVGASENEIKEWASRFQAAGSPAQLRGGIKTAVELLNSRIQAVDDQWKRGMNTDEGFPNLLSAKSKSVLDKVSKAAEAPADPRQVKLPDGRMKTFPTPAAAAAFRREAGL